MELFVALCDQHVHGSMTGTNSHPPTGWSHEATPVEVEDWDAALLLIAHRFDDNTCKWCGLDRQDAWGHLLPCEPRAEAD